MQAFLLNIYKRKGKKLKSNKKISLISIGIIILLVFTSTVNTPTIANFDSTITILYDSNDKNASFTAKNSFDIIEHFGFETIEIIPIKSLVQFYKHITDNPFILVLVFHGDKNGMKIGSRKIS